MLSHLSIAALWPPARKGLTSWLSFVMFNCVFVPFPCCILGQVWYLIVLIPDLCHLSDFAREVDFTITLLLNIIKISYFRQHSKLTGKANTFIIQLIGHCLAKLQLVSKSLSFNKNWGNTNHVAIQ